MLKSARIVWNITNSCPYNCTFCAAAANSRPIPTINKHSILDSISSVDIPISIDFSGGDPLYQPADIAVIQAAKQIFGQENIEISTTGMSLSTLDDDLIKSLAASYALTYDFPKNFIHIDPRRSLYNYHSYTQATRLQELEIPFEISLAVRHLPPNIYCALAEDLIQLNPKRIALLQMMPLGNNHGTEITYFRSETNQLISLLHAGGYEGEVTTNCAFRNECNAMTSRKLGLDEYGNLFGCIWAANLKIPPSVNEFYLGNLLAEPLSEILYKSTQKITNLPRDSCYVLEQSYKTRT